MGVAVALLLIALCVFPALAFIGFERAFDWLTSYEPKRSHAPVDPLAVLPELSADLRRLSAEHDWLLKADVPGKPARLRAIQLAYDDTLLRVGMLLQVELPAPPLLAATRLQAEAELSGAGFSW